MRKNAFQAIDHIRALNTLKVDMIMNGRPMNESDFKRAFKICGLPSNSLFWFTFKKSGQLQVVENNLFVWASEKPIHYSTLQDIYTEYQKRVNGYSRDRYNRIKEQQSEEQRKIEDAIALLKDKGYEVFVPYKGLFKKA